MTNRPKIIGLGGWAGSGKSSAAQYLEGRGYRVLNFAAPLKQAARVIFGLTEAQLYGDLKEVRDPFSFGHGRSPRYILQALGSFCRELWPEVWVRHLELQLDAYRKMDRDVVVGDVRLKNEAAMLKERGAVLVRLVRDGAGAMTGIFGHVSEMELQGWGGWDFIIPNNGTLGELASRLDDILDDPQACAV
jgi:hypothetical protein